MKPSEKCYVEVSSYSFNTPNCIELGYVSSLSYFSQHYLLVEECDSVARVHRLNPSSAINSSVTLTNNIKDYAPKLLPL